VVAVIASASPAIRQAPSAKPNPPV